MTNSKSIPFWVFMFILASSLVFTSAKAPPVSPGTIHAILLADQYSTDRIVPSCKTDYKGMKTEISLISSKTGMKTKYYSTTFSKSNLESIISSLRVRSNDVILFYYSGHGYRYQNQSQKWPCMNFRQSAEDPLHKKKCLQTLHNQLKNKKARLTVTIADCCNNICYVNEPAAMNGNILHIGYKRLFLQSAGDVLLSGSSPTEYSWGSKNDGGFLTYNFLKSLRDLCSAEEASYLTWQNLLFKVKSETMKYAKKRDRVQTPQHACNTWILNDPHSTPANAKLPEKKD